MLRQKRQKAAVDSLMVSNWSFNACNLLWLLNDIESPNGFFSKAPEAIDLLRIFVSGCAV